MTATSSLLYRMGIEGDDQVKAAIKSVGDVEEASVMRAVEASNRKAERVAAVERQLTALRKSSAESDQKAYALLTGSLEAYEAELRRLKAVEEQVDGVRQKGTNSMRNMRAGAQNLSFQIQDVSQQFALGTPYMTIFAQQGGQVVMALQQMRGETGGLLGFLAGPWGAVLTGAVLILTTMSSKLQDNSEASKAAEEGMRKFQQRQSDIGNFIDDTTGKLKEQNKTLVLNAILTRQAQIADNEKAIAEGRRKALDRAITYSDGMPGGSAGTSSVGATVFSRRTDPRVASILKSANGDVEKLSAGLAKLAKQSGDKSVDKLALDISNLAGAAILAQRDNARLNKELEQLNGKTVAQAKNTSALIEKQVALATATTAVDKARAQYNLVLARGSAADKAGGKALEQYRVDLTKAAIALRDAEAAQKSSTEGRKAASASARDHARAMRDQAKAVHAAIMADREMISALASLESQYDKLAAKRRSYDDTLNTLAKLSGQSPDALARAAGVPFDAKGPPSRLSPDKAVHYAQQAYAASLPTPDAPKGAILDLLRGDPRRNEMLKRANQSQLDGIELAKRELSLVTANDNERAAELAKLRLIQGLQAQGVDLESAKAKAILSNADAYDEILRQLDRQKQAWDEVRQVGGQFIDDVFDPKNWENWGDLGKKILQDLEYEFLKLAAINPLKNALFGSSLPTLGSVIGLFGGGGSTIDEVPMHAAGTAAAAGGLALLGEHGRELAALPQGTRVFSASDTRRMFDRPATGAVVKIYQQNSYAGNAVTPNDLAAVQQATYEAAVQGAVEVMNERARRSA